MKGQYKNHKPGNYIKIRPVCSHFQAGSRQAAEHLLLILNLIAEDLHLPHILTSTWDAHTKIPVDTDHIDAHDVDGMFDQVHLDQAYHRIAAFITASYSTRQHQHISVRSAKKARWVKATTNPFHHYTLSQSLAILHHTLFEDYAQAGNIIYRSIRGIPMGGVASTAIANLLAASLEIKLLPIVNARYPNFFYIRFVDDILCSLPAGIFISIFGPHFKQIGMDFTTSDKDELGGVSFLESTFHTHPLYATHYCKKHTLFKRPDLPHPASAMSPSHKHAQVDAAGIRFYRATSSIKAFANALILLKERNPGYPPHLFSRAFRKIIHPHTNRFSIVNPHAHPALHAISNSTLL